MSRFTRTSRRRTARTDLRHRRWTWNPKPLRRRPEKATWAQCLVFMYFFCACLHVDVALCSFCLHSFSFFMILSAALWRRASPSTWPQQTPTNAPPPTQTTESRRRPETDPRPLPPATGTIAPPHQTYTVTTAAMYSSPHRTAAITDQGAANAKKNRTTAAAYNSYFPRTGHRHNRAATAKTDMVASATKNRSPHLTNAKTSWCWRHRSPHRPGRARTAPHHQRWHCQGSPARAPDTAIEGHFIEDHAYTKSQSSCIEKRRQRRVAW